MKLAHPKPRKRRPPRINDFQVHQETNQEKKTHPILQKVTNESTLPVARRNKMFLKLRLSTEHTVEGHSRRPLVVS